jgi:hypothetical protein
MALTIPGFLQRKTAALQRTAEVGWVLDTSQAQFIWEAPRKIGRDDPAANHAKSVAYCPAVLDHEARIFEVPCPIDLRLKFSKTGGANGAPALVNAAGDQSSVRPKVLGQMMSLVGRKEWRHPDRPIVQIVTPYIFIADETVYMTQMPPFAHFRAEPLPGVLIGGRLPIHIWPRQMMWAFEWFDPSKEIVLTRGEPWFYVRFETQDPTRPVRMVEAEMTPQLKEHITGLSAVANYVNRTFSLFNTAKARRPSKLLVKKQRD